MPGSTIIIVGTGGGRVAKNFAAVFSAGGFQVTNEFPDTITVHFVSPTGTEEGSDIGITSSSTVILGAGTLNGVS